LSFLEVVVRIPPLLFSSANPAVLPLSSPKHFFPGLNGLVNDTVQFGQTTTSLSPGQRHVDEVSAKTNARVSFWRNPIPPSHGQSNNFNILWERMNRLHQGQDRRISQMPFIIHPLQVMIYVMTLASPRALNKYGAIPMEFFNEIMAACFHDVAEDQPPRYKKAVDKRWITGDVKILVDAATQDMSIADKFQRRDAFIRKVADFPRDPLLASKLVVIGADKIAGMRSFMEEVRNNLLSKDIPPGKDQSPYAKFYDERFKTLDYYKRLSLTLWNRWEQLPKLEQDRVRPLMHELVFTYFDFSQSVHELMPAHGDPDYVPSDELLRTLLEGPTSEAILEDENKDEPKLRNPDQLRRLRPELLARIPQTH
jgi:hypothetical protein